MTSEYLILGSTGSIGYAFTKVLLNSNKAVTLLVRNKEKAQNLFGENQNMELISGDAQNIDQLQKAARDKQFIFHGINYPYDKWEPNMEQVTEKIIDVAKKNKATIIFPGNIYEFGNVNEITDQMEPKPSTKKGIIRLKLFNMLKTAAENGQCKVIYLRLPDFYGPNVVNGMITRIFGHAVKNKKMNWLIRSDIPHQFVYTHDAARLMFEICKQTERDNFSLYNYGGFIFPSVNKLAENITQQTGGPSKVQNLPKFVMNIMGLFMPVMKELKENYYLFENTVILNDDKIRTAFPDFEHTSIEQSIEETLDWFKKNT